MSDPSPNCAITLHFYSNPSRFSYHCTSASRGWHVDNDGTIYQPSKRRIIQFSLSGYPTSEMRFAGFQVASSEDFSGAPDWTPASELASYGIQALAPISFPTGSQTTPGSLMIDFGPPPALEAPAEPPPVIVGLPSPRLFFRLAVVVGNDPRLHWDDPKIYDDGTI